MSSLPPDSDARAAFLVRRVFVASFFSEIGSSNLGWISERIAAAATPMRAPAGTVLFRKGEPTDSHYFVVEGAVRLETDDAPPWTFEAPALIGTTDHFIRRPRSRDGVVIADAHLFRVSSADWDEMLEDAFEVSQIAIGGLGGGVAQLRVELGEAPPAPSPEVAARSVPVHGPPLGLFERLVVLESIAAFATDDVQALTNLAGVAEEVVVQPGQAISTRGVSDDRFALVVAGRLEGTRVAGAPIETYGPGALVFGISSLCADATAFEAHAVEPTRVLTIEREDYFDLVEEHFGLAKSMMRALMIEREALVNEQARRAESK